MNRTPLLQIVAILIFASEATAHLSLIRLGKESAGVREPDAEFGYAIAAADFDGDGFEDLATGSPAHSAGNGIAETGAVVVNFGSTYGLTHEGAVALLFSNTDTNQRFGHALAAADFNADGRDDLAVAAPKRLDGLADDSGWVSIYEGNGGGIDINPSLHFHQTNLSLSPAFGDDFGWSLAAGFFNDDIYADLAIGTPGKDGGSGMVAVLYGSATGLTTLGADEFTAIDLGVSDPAGRFGSALATGHLFGSIEDELIVGAPNADVDGQTAAGRAYAIQGSATGLVPLSPIVLDETHFGLPATANAAFGAALAVGRFTSDVGLPDLAIGSPGYLVGRGRAIVTHLDTAQNGADQFLEFDRSDLGFIPKIGDRFAASMAAGDDDLDGDDELAIGSPRLDPFFVSDAGQVDLLRRINGDILDSSVSYVASMLNAELQQDGNFGSALCFGAFDWTNKANLAVGSTGADYKNWTRMEQLGFTTMEGSGQVHILAPWRQVLNMAGRSGAAFNCQDDLVFTQRPFDELAIKSTTKTMTLLLAAEDIQSGLKDPNDTITILGDKGWIVDFTIGSGETLQKSETISLINLMRLVVTISSGEACYAIASLLTNEVDPFPANFPLPTNSEPSCDPTFPIVQPTFIARMNQRASELGMLDTQFTNPHGSTSGSCLGGQRHHSTAYDMALLARAAMANPVLREFIEQKTYSISRLWNGWLTQTVDSNDLITELQSNSRLGPRGSGIKSGSGNYGGLTAVGSMKSLFALSEPSVASIFGIPSSLGRSGRADRLAGMLRIADDNCSGPGPGGILPPILPEPPGPLTVLLSIPADDGSPWTFGMQELDSPDGSPIDLHVEPWIVVDSSIQAEACFGLASDRELGPGETVDFGVSPFESHQGFRVRHVGPGSGNYQLNVSDPPSSQMISLQPGQEHIVAAHVSPAASFSLSLQNLSSSEVAVVAVEELGYCFQLDLETDLGRAEESFAASLTRSSAGIVDYEILTATFRGQDLTPGNFLAYSAGSNGAPTDVPVGDGPAELPSNTLQVQQYPNPFNPRTTIEYRLMRPGPVRVTIYDMRGRRVRLLELEARKPAGLHRIIWNGMDQSGNSVGSGVYNYRVESSEGSKSGRMALIR